MRRLLEIISSDGKLSFGRTAAAFSILYFAVQDAWFFHRTGTLVDAALIASHLAYGVTWYGVNKYVEMKNGGQQ